MREMQQDSPNNVAGSRFYRQARKEQQRYGLRNGIYRCRDCSEETKEAPGSRAVNVKCCKCGGICDPTEPKTAV